MRTEEPRPIGTERQSEAKRGQEGGEGGQRIEIGEWQSREVHEHDAFPLPAATGAREMRDGEIPASRTDCEGEGEREYETYIHTRGGGDRPTATGWEWDERSLGQ